MNLSPLPIQKFFDNNGNPMNGGLLFSYVAGTTTKIATYTDSTGGTSNTNPIVLDFRGECRIWLDQTLTYKFILAPPGDTDPPTKPIWTVDNISAAVTFASLTASIIGLILYPRTANEVSAGVTPTNYQYPEFNFLRYGADRTGVTSSNTAQAQMMAVLTASSYGADIDVPYGTYLFSTQATWTPKDASRVSVKAYGAIFKSSGAISTVKIAGGTTNGGFSFYGLQVDNHGDSSVTNAYDNVGTSRTRFYDCHVRPGGNSATYTPWLFRNSDPADANTGSYWCSLWNCSVRRLVGGDGAIPNFNVIFRGAANACAIWGGEMGDAATVVRVEPESGQTYIANGILINGVACENYTLAVNPNGAVGVAISGLRIVNSRFESGSLPGNALLSLTGSTAQPVHPPMLGFNYWTTDQVNYTLNTNSLYTYSLDSGSSGAIAPRMDSWGVLTFKNRSGNLGAFDFQTGLDDAMGTMRDASGAVVITFKSQASGLAEISGSANSLRIRGIRSLADTATSGNNNAGADAFVGAALTRVVSFGTAEPDANFKVYITATSDWGAQTKPPWITAKGTAGFTVNAQATTTSGTFDWIIVRA